MINYSIKEDGLIYILLDNLQDILLVSFGVLLGVNSRYLIYKILEKTKLRNDLIILIINSFSSFLLGFFLSNITRISSLHFSYQLVLFCSIGFLGGLSTFSTFIYDLFNLFMQYKFSSAIKLFFISLGFGIISIAFGFLLGN